MYNSVPSFLLSLLECRTDGEAKDFHLIDHFHVIYLFRPVLFPPPRPHTHHFRFLGSAEYGTRRDFKLVHDLVKLDQVCDITGEVLDIITVRLWVLINGPNGH